MGNEPRLLLLAIPYHAEIPPFLCAPTQGMALNLTYTLYKIRFFALVPLEPVPWLECRAGEVTL